MTKFFVLVVLVLAGSMSTASAQEAPEQRLIVVLHDSVRDPGAVAGEHSRRFGARVDHVYRNAIKGYAASFPGRGARDVTGDRRVARTEPDRMIRAYTTQVSATWGLDRIDQRALPLNGSFAYTQKGKGVTAYIIDSGIRYSHQEFGGRAVKGFDAIVPTVGTAEDCNGHGTHVAGTVGGTTYGVAKKVRLVSVRVLDCAGVGLTSGVIAGVDWVTRDHVQGTPAVANMSLGGSVSPSLDTAVQNSIADGISYVVAAGNGDDFGVAQDACQGSPARVPKAITISATNKEDTKPSWSNFGSCVDWFAPGVGITSAWWLTDSSTNTISGTSMAAPHVAGVAALYLQPNPAASPGAVRTALYGLTTKGIVTSSQTVNNHLLFTNL